MSLLSNRGRFSIDEKNMIDNEADLITSKISSIGKNPKKLFKIKNKINKSNNLVENKSKLKIPENFYDNKFISKHQVYNEKLNEKNVKYNDKYDEDTNVKHKSKKTYISLIIIMIIIELITIFAIVGLGTFIRLSNMTQKVTFDKAAVKNTNIDESTLAVMKGYKTVAVFGVDSRTGSVDKGNNSDVNLIVNVNLETGDAQLVSIYRDLYLSVTDQNRYDKLNSAYRKGGPEAAVKAINKNFDLNIENFFSFNWKAVADGIELLGGVDLNITKSEYKYMNAFIHETCIATGIDSKNPAAHYIKSSGEQHLDGIQAVAYGRLRLMDSDFQRVERQKKVIALCLEKAKKLDIPSLRLILEAVLPQIAYEFDMNEMLSMLKIIKNINITASCGVPETNNIVSMDMGESGDCVVPLSLEKATKILHQILFNDDSYTPSTAVKRYSNRIIELKNKYIEENKINASIKANSEEESILIELKPIQSTKSSVSKLKNILSTKSDIDKNNITNPNNNLDNKNVIPNLDYPEEPEEDDNDNIESNSEEKYTNVINEATSNNNIVAKRLAPGEENIDINTISEETSIDNHGQLDEPPSFIPQEPISMPNTKNDNKGLIVPGPPSGYEYENSLNPVNSGPVTSAPFAEPK